jgi:ribosome-associated protein
VDIEKRGEDIVILDLRGITVMTDYFVLVSAETTIQTRAIITGITEALAAQGVDYLRREGWDDARWVLLDYGDTVVHVFRKEEREYYDLERLWGDAPRLDMAQLEALSAQA